jgi:hypothetical protein
MKKVIIAIISILLILFLFLFWGGNVFTKISTKNKITELKDSIDFKKKKLFTYKTLENKPELIQRYFKSVLQDSIYIPQFISIEQSSQIKTDLNSDWIFAKSNQFFTSQKVNYLWNSDMQNSNFFWVTAIESFLNGKGNMLIKLNSSITIADSWGIELDKSGIFQYIAEAVYFPETLLPSKNLKWNILDSNIAEIKFVNNEISIVAKLFFNKDFTISKIETYDKYKSLESGFEKSLYTIYFYDYRTFNNKFKIPYYFETEWTLKSGKFKYGKFTLTNINYE